MCTFAAEFDSRRYELYIYITTFPAYLLGILRTDFNVTTGIQTDRIRSIKEKSEMKKYYAKGGIPTARQIRAAEGFDAVIDLPEPLQIPIQHLADIGRAKLSWKYISMAFGVSLYSGVMSDAVDV